MIRLVVDVNLSPTWVDVFAEQGWPAVHWSTVGDPRAKDRTVMTWARENGHGLHARSGLWHVARAGADVLLSNHVIFDGSNVKLPALAKRGAADPHPYVVGNESIQRYLFVAAECAKAGAARLLPQ